MNDNDLAARERTGRVVALTVLSWGALVAATAGDGVLAKLSDATLVALAAFALAYALATYFVDAALREYLRSIARPSLAVAAWALVAALAALGWVSFDRTAQAALLARWPIALAAFFVAPLALAIAAAAIERAARLRSSAAKQPGARPAAI